MSPHLLRPILFAMLALTTASAFAASPQVLLRFEGAIGVDPLSAAGGVDQLNVVRGISPGGRAWVINKLEATVYVDGSISVRGKGLLFASGDLIATRGAVAAVAATLTCGAADATASKFTTGPFALDEAGNFRIRGVLSEDGVNAAVLPPTCSNPQLLIRASNPTTGVAGGWFAAGIVKSYDD
jgi:hypothetical protein